jgi:O-antigen/teichoic acid export membrane protein
VLRRVLSVRLLRHNLTFLTGSLVVGLFGYVYQFLSGRLLGPRDYGIVAATFAMYTLSSVALLFVLTITMRYSAALATRADVRRLRFLFRRFTLLGLAAGTVIAVAYVALLPLLTSFLRVPTSALLTLLPAIALTFVVGVNRGTIQGKAAFGALSVVLLVESLARAALVVVLVGIGLGATGALGAVAVASVIGYGAGLFVLRDLLVGGETERVEFQEVLHFALPTVAAVAGITFLYNADIILVKHFLSDQAGVYGSVATLGRIVYFATFSITGVMFPSVSAQAARGESTTRTLELSVLAMTAVAAVLVVGFIFLPSLALLPFGPRFTPAAPYLPVFGAAMALLSLANLLVNYLLAVGDRWFALVLALAALLEVGSVWAFHGTLWQVIWGVFSALAVAVVGLASVYALHRRPIS